MGQPILPDTNVLIDFPNILNNDNIVIAYCVLEELDGLKKNKNIGHKVRELVRNIIKKDIECREFNRVNDKMKTDDKLLKIGLKNDFKIITQDFLMYKKGESKGVNIELFQPNNEVYSGVKECNLSKDIISELYKEGRVEYNSENLIENQFIDSGDIVARYKDGYLYKIDWNKSVNGIDEPTRRQLMALDVLFDNKVRLVNLFGEAGSGKTTIALNSAIRQVANGDYNNLLISRAKKKRNIDEGFAALPGELEEKYAPFIAPFYDNLYTQTPINFEIVPLASIQGRNLSGIWIITEAQDISPKHMKLIIGRCSKGTKLILEGDLKDQHSDSQLNKNFNGLTHAINKLKDKKITATVELDENKRGELSKLSKFL